MECYSVECAFRDSDSSVRHGRPLAHGTLYPQPSHYGDRVTMRQTAKIAFLGNGTLPHVWEHTTDQPDHEITDHGDDDEMWSAMAIGMMFACPFTYATYYGDTGTEHTSDLLLPGEVIRCIDHRVITPNRGV